MALAVGAIIAVEFSLVQAPTDLDNYEANKYTAKRHFESFQTFVISVIKWLGHLSAEELIALFTGILAAATIFLWFSTQRILTDTRRTNEMQLRAYVYPVSSILTEGKVLKPPRTDRVNFPGIFLEWKNTGQTPAYNVISWAAIEMIEPINEDKLLIPKLAEIHFTTLEASVTGTKSMWNHRALTKEEITDVGTGARGIYLFGTIQYKDIFKEDRFSNFRLIHTGKFPPHPGATFSICEKGNDSK